MNSQQQQGLGVTQALEHERQVIAQLQHGGRRIFLLGEFSRHLVAYASQHDLLLEQWTAIWKRDHMRGIDFSSAAIIAAPGFTTTQIWRTHEGTCLLNLAQAEGALFIHPDGSGVNLASRHPVGSSRLEGETETLLRSRGQTNWDDPPPVSPIEIIRSVMDLYRDATGINAHPINFTEEDGQIVFRAGDQVLQRYNIPGRHSCQPAYAACAGCVHYDGAVYGGNRLICAMHPYGPEGQSCPDHESVRKTAD